MSDFEPDLPASAVDARPRAAVAELRRAEQNAVLWFAELMRRRLYRDCGYSSIHAYAEAVLGFTEAKTYQFIRLAESLEKLPGLRASVASGRLSWTKARSVASVATPASEAQWVALATQSSSRELESRIRESRREANADPRQRSLLPPAESPGPQSPPKVQLKSAWSPSNTPAGRPSSSNCANRGTAKAARSSCWPPSPRWPKPSVHVYKARRPTRWCSTAARPAAGPDCRMAGRWRPRLRRAVLARDGHRCLAPGCRATRFLEVHHRYPRERGCRNSAENLISLCGACHRLLHEAGGTLAVALPPPDQMTTLYS